MGGQALTSPRMSPGPKWLVNTRAQGEQYGLYDNLCQAYVHGKVWLLSIVICGMSQGGFQRRNAAQGGKQGASTSAIERSCTGSCPGGKLMVARETLLAQKLVSNRSNKLFRLLR